MIDPRPVVLERNGVRLEPLTAEHRDGSVRDIVIYSVPATEWPDVRRHLELRLMRNRETRDR